MADSFLCANGCGKRIKQQAMHDKYCAALEHDAASVATNPVAAASGGVAVADAPPVAHRSARGQRRYAERILSPLEQIPVIPNIADTEMTGAWAYYIRPDGATISDALIALPNGGIPDIDNQRQRSRYGTDALLHRTHYTNKGYEYIGPNLTDGGVQRLVSVLASNREDEILYIEEEREAAERGRPNRGRM